MIPQRLSPALLLIQLLLCCQPKQEIKPIDLAGCADPRYTRTTPIALVDASITVLTFYTTTGAAPVYYLERAGSTLAWQACNLPDAYKPDPNQAGSLPVRISGYALTYPGMDLQQMSSLPIELTHIELRPGP